MEVPESQFWFKLALPLIGIVLIGFGTWGMVTNPWGPESAQKFLQLINICMALEGVVCERGSTNTMFCLLSFRDGICLAAKCSILVRAFEMQIH